MKVFSLGLFRFAKGVVFATLVLISLGGMVTSVGGGLSMPDWPTTFGYNMFTFPISQWEGLVFWEQIHRLAGALVGLLTLVLAVWVLRKDDRVLALDLGVGVRRLHPARSGRGDASSARGTGDPDLPSDISGRNLEDGGTTMNRLYVLESVPTITGASADERRPLGPRAIMEYGVALAKALGVAVSTTGAKPKAGARCKIRSGRGGTTASISHNVSRGASPRASQSANSRRNGFRAIAATPDRQSKASGINSKPSHASTMSEIRWPRSGQ